MKPEPLDEKPIAMVLLFTVLGVSCRSNPGKINAPAKTAAKPTVLSAVDSDRNNSIAIAQVEVLPEFKNILKWFNKINKDTSRHIVTLIERHPDTGFKYYLVSVGEDTPDHFVHIVSFYVDAHDLSIHYDDELKGDFIALSQGRKSGRDKWFY